MKLLNLLLWVGQFGFSVLFPTVICLWFGFYLQSRFALGVWITLLLGGIGLLTSWSTAKACLRSLQQAAGEAGEEKEKPVSFNTHK